MRPVHRIRQASFVVGLAAILLALGGAGPLSAQTLTNAFGGLSENSSDPIDIEADLLTVYDAKKKATFKGNVKVVQGATTLLAAELDVYYIGGTEKFTGEEAEVISAADKGAKPDEKEGPEAQISKIEARGSVVIKTADDQTTTSDWALYDVSSQLVTVGGNVVLSQGQNVLKGDQLIIDLKTGESRFENTGASGTGGRVRALFMPSQGNATKPADAKRKKSKTPGKPEKSSKSKKPVASTAASGEASAPAKQAPSEPLPIMPEFR